MLRCASIAQGDSPLVRPPAGTGARGGSAMRRQISAARTSPGTPAAKKAVRQPQCSATHTSTIGASAVPSTDPNTFWTIPALSPRRLSSEAAAMIARQIGRKGPSAAPITTRVANKVPKLHDSPDSTEQKEKTTIATSRKGFRRPIESDQRPTK